MSARDLPNHEARAAELIGALMADYLAPPPRMTVSEWAESRRFLSAKDSSEPGPYRVSRTPYAREPQDALSAHSSVEEVVLMWGAQTSKTTIGGNWLGYLIDLQPGPVMVVQPTIDTAKRYSRQRLTPMIEESPALRKKVRDNRSRDDANTTLLKEYAGGFLALAGANSAAGLRSMPIRDIFFDEIDAYPHDVDGEGDPISLAEARQSTFARRKRLKTSTPTTKDFSRIEAAFQKTDQRYYEVPCPDCGHLQALEWGAGKAHGLHWDKNEAGHALPHTAHYVCIVCGSRIAEHNKPGMLAGGAWVPTKPDTRAHMRGYHLNSLYSPLGWLSWSVLVSEWVDARTAANQGDQTKLRAFINTRLAETWEEQGDKVQHHELARRAEPYELGVVPMRGLLVCMGVDTQPDRLEARIWAWGRGEESWLVQRHIIYGDPNLEEAAEGSPWAALTAIRRTAVPHASGSQLLIEATCIDTAGHNTQAVYNYCRAHAHAHVLAIIGRGSAQGQKAPLGKPSNVDVTWRGKTQARGLKLWTVGVDTVKHLLYGRLRLTEPGFGYIHLPADLKETDEFEQMTAERLVTKYVKGHARLEWFKPNHKRNEALDCMVYAYAAACYLGLPTFKEGSWAKRQQRTAPREPDLFAQAALVAQATGTDSHQNNTQEAVKPTRITSGRISLSGTRRGAV